MSLNLTCQRVTEPGQRGVRDEVLCGQPAVIVIVTNEEVWHAGDVQEIMTVAFPVCADHAPEEVHETRCSMGEDEFTVINI